ncbi:putative nuclease HARBI1 [Mizuhopecten yessoensis]|uniref:putative nuclease HARBI1 n=1 Tax=Mizuhopecten yessoensis TaxID=6573 RepID=UPI000B45D918|nr:putative nuclease HARBI1 [Mizuhopecten yessoensis]
MDRFDDREFKRDFRITRNTFDILLNEVVPHIESTDRPCGRDPLKPNHKLLIFLWYMANQDCMREISRLFNVSKSSVFSCVREVSFALCNEMQKYIHWPDQTEQDEAAEEIKNSTGIPGVVGFIDGTHIRLSSVPNGDSGYIDRKGFPSLQLQVVVSHNMLIIDAYVGWPGSVHDARVYKNSPLFDGLQTGMIAPGHFLIGDGAYPLSEVMITPFRQTGNLSAQQKHFNKKVSSVRQTVERSIGHMKQRFRRLRDLSCRDMKSACEIIMSGCILHNMCILHEDDLSEYLDNYDGNQVVNNYPPVYLDNARGVRKRNEIVQLLNANR